jgi:hypothetical protein
VKYFDKKVKFQEAEKICESNNATLISIHSFEENEFITRYVAQQPSHSSKVWIGLKRNISGYKEFVWVDKSPLDYVFWQSYVRPNYYGGPEHYIEMLIDQRGTWNDTHDVNSAFVCGIDCKLLRKF